MLTPLLLALLFGAPVGIPAASTQDAPLRQEAIDAAIDRGAAFLLQVAEPGGRRGRKPKKARVATERLGMRALVLYTLLECGADEQGGAVQGLLTGLGVEPVEQTYDAACLLLALAAHDPIGHRPWMEELALQLLGWQEGTGDWGYPGMIIDLSNTQYAALGLWAAARAGVALDPAVWERLARAVLRYGGEAGGFSYTAGAQDATGSMTAAGVGILALCEVHLRRAAALPADLEPVMVAVRSEALTWLDGHFSVETNPRSGAWLYYYLYGLERMGALAGDRLVGEHDWYAEGAAYLVARQEQDGSWRSGTDLSETCFALLFLKRATAAEVGPRTPGKDVERRPEEQGAVTLAFQGAGPVTLWVDGWRPLDVSPLEWPGERGLGPRVARVEYRVDGELVGVVLGDAARPAAGARFALQWVPDRTGTRTLTARVHLAHPAGGAAVLESGEIPIEVERALPAWIAHEPRDLGPNLAPSFRPSASASSRPKKVEGLPALDFTAERAVDGLARSPWLAHPTDRKRALKVSYRKARPVDVVRIIPAVLPARGTAFLSRPLSIEVVINGRATYAVRLEEPGRPATVELGKPVKIKRLDVRILEVAPGEHPAFGIGEVELYARGR